MSAKNTVMNLPDSLGKYKIEGFLGEGAYAHVYQALDTSLDRRVALKVLKTQLLADPSFLTHFHQEAKTMAKVDHPAIVRIYTVEALDSYHFLTMQFADQGALADRLAAQGGLSWAETLDLLAPLTTALSYAHQQGIVHRDLKPQNILLDEERGPLLSDFGFASMLSRHSLGLSMSGGIVGTAAYIAPEVWEGETATPAVDVYALGCVVYEMLTAKTLFDGPTPMVIMRAHDKGPQFNLSKLKHCPTGIEQVLNEALTANPAQRFSSVAEFFQALKDLDKRAAKAERQAQAKREAEAKRQAEAKRKAEAEAAQKAAIAPWRDETNKAIAEKDWRVAKMAVGRWLALAPNDEKALAAQAVINEALAPKPKPAPASNTNLAPDKPEKLPKKPAKNSSKLLFIVIAILAVLALCGMGVVSALFSNSPSTNSTTTINATNTPPATATPTTRPSTTSLDVGSTRQRTIDGMTQVYVPAGSFMMGSNEFSDESPIHEVTLDAFWLDRTEVTNEQYERCVTAGDCEASEYADDSRFNGPTQPVVGVSWNDATAYCTWAGADLPTEAQWEYAARGPDSLVYPWGNAFVAQNLNYCDSNCEYNWADESVDDGYQFTAPVGSFPAGDSWVGAADMSGNVWEWVSDWYDSNYYANSPSVNPSGALEGESKVLRGGSWAG